MPDGMNVGSLYSDFELRTEDAERRLEQARQQMERLRQAFATGSMSVDQYEAEMRSLGQEVDRLQRSLAAAGAGAERIKLEPAARGFRNIGQAALEGSRAIEDLQYGVAGVVNNIPSLVMAMGGSAGLTAAISLAAVAASQLYKHWDELMGAFGQTSPIRSATEELEKLEKVANRTATQEGQRAFLRGRAGLAERLKEPEGGVDRGAQARVERALTDDAELREAALGAVERQRNPRGLGVEAWGRAQAAASADWTGMTDVNARAEAEKAAEREAIREQVAGAAYSREQMDSLSGLLRNTGRDDLARRLESAAAEPSAYAEPGGIREFGPGRDEMTRGLAEQRGREAAARREAEALEQENAANAERYFEEERRRADELAKGIQGRYDVATLAGGEFDVAGALGAAGLEAPEADRMAPMVGEALAKGLEEAIQSRALETGLGPDQARADLLDEGTARLRDEAREAAEAADPGLEARAERYATMRMLSAPGTFSAGQLEREIAQSLMGKGLTSEQATLAAQSYAGEAASGAEQFAGGMGEQAGQVEMRAPESFDASQLLDKVQAGVGQQDEQGQWVPRKDRGPPLQARRAGTQGRVDPPRLSRAPRSHRPPSWKSPTLRSPR
jgi:uncharacterized coiled-coil protein SlyX